MIAGPLAGCTGRLYRKGFCCKVFRLHHKPLSLDRLLVTMVQSLIKVFLFLALPSHLWAQPSSECPRVTKEHTDCLDRLNILNIKHQYLPFSSCRAYKDYKAAVEAGEDGEPHFHARKACDYLKSAVEVLPSVLYSVVQLFVTLYSVTPDSSFSWMLRLVPGLREHAGWRLLHRGGGAQTEG